MPGRVLGARERTEDDPTLREDVERMLDEIEERGEGMRVEQLTKAVETVDSVAGPSPVFRPATRSEIEAASIGLAQSLTRSPDPSEADINAALVMIMDAEDQRRILFEQSTGVRTPDPITGVSSLDEGQPEFRQPGVGEPVPRPTFFGNVRAFFDLP